MTEKVSGPHQSVPGSPGPEAPSGSSFFIKRYLSRHSDAITDPEVTRFLVGNRSECHSSPCPITRPAVPTEVRVPGGWTARLRGSLSSPIHARFQAPGSAPELPPHEGTLTYLGRNKPLIAENVVDLLEKEVSIAGGILGGLFFLRQWLRRSYRRRPTLDSATTCVAS